MHFTLCLVISPDGEGAQRQEEEAGDGDCQQDRDDVAGIFIFAA